ncbi:MAG: ABC transporter permease subunit [Dehalococcoidia bacterium]
MGQYVLRRALLIVPTLFLVSCISFLIVAFLPGDAVDAVMQRGGAKTFETKEALRAELGLDKPWHIRYIAWFLGWPRPRGIILGTRDGGDNWRPLSEGVKKLFTDASFVDDRKGWAVSNGGEIFHTRDGGIGWRVQNHGYDESLNGVTFLDDQQGWAVGDKGGILHTTDGGEIWAPQTSGTEQRLNDVFFLDSSRGWTVGDKGTLLATANSGITWIQGISTSNSNLSALSFVDATSGWVVGKGGVILRTVDGGRSWTEQTSGTSKDLTDVWFTDGSTGWIVGRGGIILHTTTGGLAWVSQSSGTNKDLSGLSFQDRLQGWAVGDDGQVLRTSDGGITWRVDDFEVPRPIDKPFTAVTFINDQVGWVVGWESTWRWGILGGNLGRSLLNQREAVSELGNRVPVSLELMLLAVIISLIIAVPIGVVSGVRPETPIDYIGRIIAILGLSMPAFWVATLIILLPAVWWRWAPPLQYVPFLDDPLGNLKFFALPALVVGLTTMGSITRMTRAMMLEVLRQDYIRTAWAKGLKERSVIVRHALKNAMIPVLTIVGIQIPFILGEQVLIEFIFNIPGIGRLGWSATVDRDYTMLQAVILVIGSAYIGMNLIVDLLYAWLDPRIRYA